MNRSDKLLRRHIGLSPALQGFGLQGDHDEALPATHLGDSTLPLHSAMLGLDVRLEQGQLR
jgi:hypothetical protein